VLEAQLKDGSDLAVGTKQWLDWWRSRLDGLIRGESFERGSIPLEVIDAVIAETGDGIT